MRKRLLLSLGLLACLVAGCVAFHGLTKPAKALDESRFALIEKGMTRQEVEEIIGCPPGDYRAGALIHRFLGEETAEQVAWRDDHGGILVCLDREGKVEGIERFLPLERAKLSHKLRRWLGLPWW